MKIFFQFFLIIMVFTFNTLSANQPQLNVRGEAIVSVPADELSLTIGVITQNKEASIALKDNNNKMADIIAQLRKTGLSDAEYKTGYFSIYPLYMEKSTNAENFQTEIIGYKVSNTLEINSNQISLAGKFIDEAVKSGANNVSNIQFHLKDSNKFWNEAITLATQNAMSNALILAQAAQVQLDGILNIQLENNSSPTLRNKMLATTFSSDSTSIEAGSVPIQANVTIQYALKK
ncbi:MAG: hypothetical protein BGO10_01515 [Chlamydia sp. 32-24]|nr:MAG: hypothetical protein BGO10_01515 [Chlamydia sp. 32-24]